MNTIAIVCAGGIFSGKERMALELAEGLRQQDCEVHLLTSRWGAREFWRRVDALGIPTQRLWLGFVSATLKWEYILCTLDQVWHWPGLLFGFWRFIRDVKPSKILHTNWHHALLLLPLLRLRRDVFWLHDVVPNKPHYRRIYQLISHRVEYFAAVSNVAANSLVNIGVDAKKVRVIYNGITDPTHSCRRGLRNGGNSIGIVGQVGPWKGHEDLLQAFKVIVETQENVRLDIFGKGDSRYEKFLRRRATELGLEEHVRWRGFTQDRVTIYCNLDVLVIPSRCQESFGLSAVEAAFFGIPVVASQHGALPEVVKNRVTGFLFPPRDISKLADCLALLIRDASLRSKLGENARSRAIELFGVERLTKQFVALLALNLQRRQGAHRRND